MRTNVVLIDYENVQPAGLDLLDHDYFKVLLFVGENQTRLSRELVFALHRMGNRAEYVEIAGNGRNALDFHIAYTIGRLAAENPNAYFHICAGQLRVALRISSPGLTSNIDTRLTTAPHAASRA